MGLKHEFLNGIKILDFVIYINNKTRNFRVFLPHDTKQSFNLLIDFINLLLFLD